jgi:hypothetical protein
VATIKASEWGLAKIKQARKEKGWTVENPCWLMKASQVIQPNQSWENLEYFADGVSLGTWKRFLAGIAINTRAFQAYCRVLELEWQEVVERLPNPPITANFSSANANWGEAPDVPVFYGRTAELMELEKWLVLERCRLVALLGMGGIGKTALSVRLAEGVVGKFECLVWRSLRHAPSLQAILKDLIECLSGDYSTDLSNNVDVLMSTLLQILRQRRVLLFLDGWDTLLGGESVGCYQPGYEKYGVFLKRIAQERHESCLVITSREKPETVTFFEGEILPVRAWKLVGLGEASNDILRAKGLVYAAREWKQLIQIYRGNPLALNIVASVIKDLFNGSVRDFLIANTIVLDRFETILNESVRSLSKIELEILCCLANESKPIDAISLRNCMASQVSFSVFFENLSSLERRSLIEKFSEGREVLFSLQPVVMKYVKRFII